MLVRAGVDPEMLQRTPLASLPFQGAMIKNESDLDRLASTATG